MTPLPNHSTYIANRNVEQAIQQVWTLLFTIVMDHRRDLPLRELPIVIVVI